ncbi:MAG: RES domain-containing protein, partial [Acidimicrobiaceae bacterium]|nr:RES domain-containing protein [Acidimicrobiaceae bacterium]
MSGEGSSAHDLPVRALRGQHYWHQVPVRHEVVYVPVSPSYGARFHVAGGDGVWYASSTREGAWSEFFRHFLDDGADSGGFRTPVPIESGHPFRGFSDTLS